jgi:hypothetical protein
MVKAEENYYGQFDSFVVLAENKGEALRMVFEKLEDVWVNWGRNDFYEGATVKIIKTNKPCIVLESYKIE